MPDSPDWSKYLPGSVRFSLQDMSELAVRLGSPDSWDRRGEVFLIDVFDHGLSSWTETILGSDSTISMIADNASGFGYSVDLHAGVNASANVLIDKKVPLYASTRFGLEVSFILTNSPSYFIAEMFVRNGTYVSIVGFKLDIANSELQLVTGNPGYTSVTGIGSLVSSQHIPITIKVVFDNDKQMYQRLIFNGAEIDVSTISGYVAASSAQPYSEIIIQMLGNLSNTSDAIISRVICTTNEP